MHNAPINEEVAVIFEGEDGAAPGNRNIVVYPRDQHLRCIAISRYLMYPISFPRQENVAEFAPGTRR